MALNARQRLFVAEYLKDRNATAAYQRAGYAAQGDAAKAAASRLLTNVYVAAAVERGMRRLEERTNVTAERVLRELARIGFSDLRELFAKGNKLADLADLDDDAAAAVASVEVLEEYQGSGKARKLVGFTRKVKLWNKVEALKLIGTHLKMFAEQHELKGDAALIKALMGLSDAELHRTAARVEESPEGPAVCPSDPGAAETGPSGTPLPG